MSKQKKTFTLTRTSPGMATIVLDECSKDEICRLMNKRALLEVSVKEIGGPAEQPALAILTLASGAEAQVRCFHNEEELTDYLEQPEQDKKLYEPREEVDVLVWFSQNTATTGFIVTDPLAYVRPALLWFGVTSLFEQDLTPSFLERRVIDTGDERFANAEKALQQVAAFCLQGGGLDD